MEKGEQKVDGNGLYLQYEGKGFNLWDEVLFINSVAVCFMLFICTNTNE